MAISPNHLKNFCQSDGDERSTCKYLSHRMSSEGYKPICTKLCPSQQGKSSSWNSGDNCKGLPFYLHVLQGYDVADK